MTELVAVTLSPVPGVDLAVDLVALHRLPGSSEADPFLRLAAAFLAAYPANSARSYRTDLRAWATWCATVHVHPLGGHHRPPPPVSDGSATVGLSADELRRLLATATQHSPRLGALVGLLVLNGLRISEALATDVRDYGHDRGHRVLRILRKGGKTARIPLALRSSARSMPTSTDAPAGRSSSPPTAPAATPTPRPSPRFAAPPAPPASPPPMPSPSTARLTPSPPKPSPSTAPHTYLLARTLITDDHQ